MDRRGFISSIIAATVASQIEGSELPVTVDDVVADGTEEIVMPERAEIVITPGSTGSPCCSG
jgi:hypothetical protein